MKIQILHRLLVVAVGGGLLWVAERAPAQIANSAPAYGVAQVLKLKQANVGEDTIIAFIKNSGNSYNLDADQIINLRQQGVSDAVLTTMLNQPRLNVTPAPAPDTSAPQAVAAPAQPAVTYVQTASPTVAYVPAAAPVYYYPSYYPSSYYYPSYGCYGWSYPAVSLSFGWGGGCYYGGGWRGGNYNCGSGWHGGGYYGNGWHGAAYTANSWHGGSYAGNGWHGGGSYAGGWHGASGGHGGGHR